VGRAGLLKGAPAITRVWKKQSRTLQNGATYHFDLPLRNEPFRVELSVDPTFVPATYGLSDIRTLGVQASFIVR
jgi:hypothetical protein